jgi:hypothetical protein
MSAVDTDTVAEPIPGEFLGYWQRFATARTLPSRCGVFCRS